MSQIKALHARIRDLENPADVLQIFKFDPLDRAQGIAAFDPAGCFFSDQYAAVLSKIGQSGGQHGNRARGCKCPAAHFPAAQFGGTQIDLSGVDTDIDGYGYQSLCRFPAFFRAAFVDLDGRPYGAG